MSSERGAPTLRVRRKTRPVSTRPMLVRTSSRRVESAARPNPGSGSYQTSQRSLGFIGVSGAQENAVAKSVDWLVGTFARNWPGECGSVAT